MSFDNTDFRIESDCSVSQSLWNRAMSFDHDKKIRGLSQASLNPFGTGQCLSTDDKYSVVKLDNSLNPFGTGQCLSTNSGRAVCFLLKVSIPLEQGNVFRPQLFYLGI